MRLKSFLGVGEKKGVAFIVSRRRDERREIITWRENRANPRGEKLADAQNANGNAEFSAGAFSV